MSSPAPSGPPAVPEGAHWWERSVGGLPLGVWLIVVPAGILIALVVRRSVANASAAVPATSGNDGTPLVDPSTGLPLGNPTAGSTDTTIANGFNTNPITAVYYNLAYGDIFGSATLFEPQGIAGPAFVESNNYPTAGSTMQSIADSLGLTLDQLLALNPGITSPQQIVPGTPVRIR